MLRIGLSWMSSLGNHRSKLCQCPGRDPGVSRQRVASGQTGFVSSKEASVSASIPKPAAARLSSLVSSELLWVSCCFPPPPQNHLPPQFIKASCLNRFSRVSHPQRFRVLCSDWRLAPARLPRKEKVWLEELWFRFMHSQVTVCLCHELETSWSY